MIRDFEVPDSLRDKEETRRAFLVLKYAHDSAAAFLDAFDRVRTAREAGRGTTSEQERDLLRAMLVMAAAGLDSMLKQLIRDSVRVLATSDEQVRNELEKFVQRQLREDSGERRLLASVLTSESPQQRVIEEYITDLTGASLQSPDQIIKAAKALGLKPDEIEIDQNELMLIFRTRNKIIHELDIDFDAARRNRASRAKQKMADYCNSLLATGEHFLLAIDSKLELLAEA